MRRVLSVVACPARLLVLAAIALAPSGSGAQDAELNLLRQETAELRNANEELRQLLEAQARRTEALERRLETALAAGRIAPAAPVAPAASTRTASAPTAAPRVDMKRKGAKGSTLDIYGFLRLDGIYHDARVSDNQVISFVRSSDPAAPAGIGGGGAADDFTMHPKLTRIGADFDGPAIADLGGADLTGKLEIDFYNATGSESRSVIRMRHGWLRLTWDDFYLQAGQTFDVISPLYPQVNPDLAMWGAGNLGDRRPQLIANYTSSLGAGRLTLTGSAGLSGALDGKNLGPVTDGALDGEGSGLPTFQGRVAYSYPLGDGRKVEVGLWGHRAWEETASPVGAALEGEFDAHSYGIDFQLPLYRDRVTLKGEIWRGENLSDVRGGILQGINLATGEEVGAEGGWVELGWKVAPHYSFHTGFATDNPDDGDLSPGGRSRNDVYYIANRFDFDPFAFGIDWLNWNSNFVGFDEADANRIQTYFMYKF